MPEAREEKRVVLLVATLAAFLTPFLGAAVNIALPAISKELALNAVQLSWVATAYLLAAATFLVPFGKLADIYGRRRIFTYGIILFTISCLLAMFAPNALWLLTGRVLQGIGSAMIFATSLAMLSDVFPTGERGKALGINVASTYIGLSVGPFFGGLLTEVFGWRSVFSANALLGFIAALFTLWKLRPVAAVAHHRGFDYLGSVLYGAALVAVMYGLSLLPKTAGIWLSLLGLLLLSLFLWRETHIPDPVLSVSLFRGNTVLSLSNLAAFINYSATSAVGFLLSLYLQYVKGLPPQTAGLVLLAQPIIMAAISPLAGRLSDSWEPRTVASAGMAVTATALFLLSFLGQSSSLVFVIAELMLLGFGLALFSSPNSNAIMGAVEKRHYGLASALLGTMRLTGQMFSMGIAAMILAANIGVSQITPAQYAAFVSSMRMTLYVFTGFCVLGVFASLARGQMHNNSQIQKQETDAGS